MLRARRLSELMPPLQTYNKTTNILKGLSMTVPAGTIYGLLGARIFVY